MAEITVKVGSITNAQKGKKALLKHGFRAKVIRSRHIQKGDGCGYSIVFNGNQKNGLDLLKKAGVNIISVSSDDIP